MLMPFAIASAVFGVLASSVGVYACVRPTGWSETILGYTFLFMAAYVLALGCLAEAL